MHNYLQIPEVLCLEKKNRCLLEIYHNHVVIHSLSINQLLIGYLSELHTIFTGIANITCTSIGIGVVRSHKAAAKSSIKAENSKMHMA